MPYFSQATLVSLYYQCNATSTSGYFIEFLTESSCRTLYSVSLQTTFVSYVHDVNNTTIVAVRCIVVNNLINTTFTMPALCYDFRIRMIKVKRMNLTVTVKQMITQKTKMNTETNTTATTVVLLVEVAVVQVVVVVVTTTTIGVVMTITVTMVATTSMRMMKMMMTMSP